MCSLSEKIDDTIQDDVSPNLQALTSRKGWNAEAIAHLAQLKKQLKREGYKAFVGHASRYHLTRIGQSCPYDVPMVCKGFLSDFRGKRIRLVCVSSGKYARSLLAGTYLDKSWCRAAASTHQWSAQSTHTKNHDVSPLASLARDMQYPNESPPENLNIILIGLVIEPNLPDANNASATALYATDAK